MADDGKTFDINLRTAADTAGAAQTKEALADLTAETEKLSVSTKAYIADEQQRAAAAMEAAGAEQELTEAQIQRQAIVTTKLEALQAEAAGRTEEAAALNREVQQMTIALGLQKELNISQEEALTLAEETLAAKEAIAFADAEDAAANASSGLRGLGSAGRATQMLGGALGLGEIAGQIGFAVFALYEMIHVVGEVIGFFEKAAEAQRKIGEEADKTTAKIDEQYNASVKLKEPIDRWKDSITAARDAINEAKTATDTLLDAQNKIGAAQEKLDIARIEGSDLSPEEKAKRIAGIEAAYDDQKSQREQAQYAAAIDAEQKKVKIANDNSTAASEEASKREANALEARNKAKADVQEQERLKKGIADLDKQIAVSRWVAPAEADEEREKRSALQERLDHLHPEDNIAKSTAADKASEEAQNAAKKAAEEAARAQKEGAAKIADLQTEAGAAFVANTLDAQAKEQEAANKAAEEKKKAADKAAEKAKEAAKEAARKEHEQQIKEAEDRVRLQEGIASDPKSTQGQVGAALDAQKEAADKLAELRNPGDAAAAALEKQIADQRIEKERAEIAKRNEKDAPDYGDAEARSIIAAGQSGALGSGNFSDDKALRALLEKLEAAQASKDRGAESELLPRIIALLENLFSSPTQGAAARALEGRVRALEGAVKNQRN